MINKFNLGDEVFTKFNDKYERFIVDSVELINLVKGNTIIYNGLYEEENCFSSLKETYENARDKIINNCNKELDKELKTYLDTIKKES